MTNQAKVGHLSLNQSLYDYFTITSYDAALFNRFKPLQGESNDVREQKINQYVGEIAYFHNGSLFVGSGRQRDLMHDMVKVSGELAEELSVDVREAVREDAARLRRVDIQVTIQEPSGYHDSGQWRLFNRLKRADLNPGWRESRDARFGPMATVYRGSNRSDRFARCYQKPCDADRPLLRLEFVLQQDRAEAYGRNWTAGKVSKGRAYSALLDWFGDEYVCGYFRSAVEGFHPYLPTVTRKETKTERWLLGTVLRTFARYINQHDHDGKVVSAFQDVIDREGRIG